MGRRDEPFAVGPLSALGPIVMLGAHTEPPAIHLELGSAVPRSPVGRRPSRIAARPNLSPVAASWTELVDFAVFFPGSLAESVLELDAHCRRREREAGIPHPSLVCDELGAHHLGFRLETNDVDPVSEGLALFTRLTRRDDRCAEVRCVDSGPGFARFRVSYRRT